MMWWCDGCDASSSMCRHIHTDECQWVKGRLLGQNKISKYRSACAFLFMPMICFYRRWCDDSYQWCINHISGVYQWCDASSSMCRHIHTDECRWEKGRLLVPRDTTSKERHNLVFVHQRPVHAASSRPESPWYHSYDCFLVINIRREILKCTTTTLLYISVRFMPLHRVQNHLDTTSRLFSCYHHS